MSKTHREGEKREGNRGKVGVHRQSTMEGRRLNGGGILGSPGKRSTLPSENAAHMLAVGPFPLHIS